MDFDSSSPSGGTVGRPQRAESTGIRKFRRNPSAAADATIASLMKPSPSACLAALSLAALGSSGRAQIAVTDLRPAAESTATLDSKISIRFASTLDPTTVGASSIKVFGKWSGVVDGTVSLAPGNQEIVFVPGRAFFPGEWVQVSTAASVQTTGGASLTGGYAWGFWAPSAAGSMQFTETLSFSTRLPGEVTTRTYGGYAGDIDRDGTPDLSLTNEDTHDVRVFFNTDCSTFGGANPHQLVNGSRPSPSEGADFNGDGWTDLAVACTGNGDLAILMGNGSGYDPAIAYSTSQGTRGVATLDLEGDGDVDVVTANFVASTLAVFENDGTGQFQAPTFFDAGPQERTIAAADANGDGWTDLFVGDFMGAMTLMLSDGAGGFTQSATTPVSGNPWMVVTGDVNGDGYPDAVTANSFSPTVSVILSDGLGGLLAEQTYPTGGFTIAVDLGDLDGDGWLDLVSSSYNDGTFWVYPGGPGGFGTPIILQSAVAGSCALLVDLDRDGDLDIVGVDELADVVKFYMQDSVWPAGVATPLCEATLRVNGLSIGAGFGGASSHPVRVDDEIFLHVSGRVTAFAAIMLGSPVEPGLPTPFGIANLANFGTLVFTSQLDGYGELSIPLTVPSSVSIGQVYPLQAIVASSPFQIQLSNPEALQIIP